MRVILCCLLLLASAGISFGQRHSKDSVYTKADQMPEFPGGIGALQKYLSQNIRFPEQDKEDMIQEKTIVKFVIDRKGKTRDINVVRSVSKLFDKNVIDVVKNMPVWKPGRNNGRTVHVAYTLPIYIHYGE